MMNDEDCGLAHIFETSLSSQIYFRASSIVLHLVLMNSGGGLDFPFLETLPLFSGVFLPTHVYLAGFTTVSAFDLLWVPATEGGTRTFAPIVKKHDDPIFTVMSG